MAFCGKRLGVLLASVCALFASCDFGFDSDSFQNKAGSYFKEMTSTAAVANYSMDMDNVQTDKNGNFCFGYESDRTVTFTLRNPQHYTFLTNRNMTLGLAGNAAGGAAMPLSETVTLVQDSSDTTKLVLTFPAEFLKANPLGADISPIISMMHPVSLAQFTPYKDLKLSSNATPPMPNGAIVMQTTETPSRWVVCFNMPNSAIINEFHRDLESVRVNDSYAKISVNGGIISLEGGGISASAPAGLVANQNTGLSFAPNGQAVYYSTGDEADEKERVYTVTVTDNAGLMSSFGISTRGFKLSAPNAYLTDDASFANPFSVNYSSAKNFVSQEDDGSSFIYLHGTAKTEAVNYTDSSGNARSIPQYDYDPSNAQILYEVYLEDTFTTLVDSGMIKGLGGKIPVPAGTSYVRAYVRKPLYSDSEVITWWCRAVSTRFFVSEIGDDVMNTGSRDKPYRTIQKAVNMFGEGIYQGDYDADCSCTIKVLGDELTPPDDFDFDNNSGAYINIPDPAIVPQVPLASATVNIEGDGGTKTVNLKGRDAKILSASCGNVVLTNINLTGADFSSDSYNEALVEIASAASVRMNSVAISKNNLSVAATSVINIVKNSGTLRMNDSSVAENTRSIDGSTCVVLNCDGGETTLSNTSILNHHEDWTPAFIAASATFDMTGGEIKDNTESNYIIESNGLVTMTGVTVQNNGNLDASSGIHIVGNKMTLKDCVITKNKADCGAGIMVDDGELYLDSCSITENTAADDGAGVFCSSSATKISLKGKNTIYDNHTVSEPAKQNNIYLDDNATPPDLPTLKLTIESDISGSKIGLHYPEAIKPTLSVSIPFTSGYNYGTKNKDKPGACFSSDYNYGISDISSNEAAFVVSSGSMYGALDYTFDFELKAADGVTAASAMYFGKDASFVIAPTVARREQGATPASSDLYLNPADRKLYLDAGFTKKAAGDELVTLTAKLYSGGSKAEDLDITWEADKISLAVPASKATLADNYTIKVFRTFLGVDSSSSFAVACNKSAEAAAAYIQSLSVPGTYTVEVEGAVGPRMSYISEEIQPDDDGLAKVAKAIKNAASDVMIILDARGTSYVPAPGDPNDDDYNPYSEYNNNSYFAGCEKLKEVYLPDWLQYIVTRSYGASHIGLFENCRGLTKVELSSNVKLLMYNAFKGCYSLARISLPAKISEASSLEDPRGIQAGAFVGCAEGFKIDFAGTKEQWGSVNRPDQTTNTWHVGGVEDSADDGSVTCSDGDCGFDYVYAYAPYTALPSGASGSVGTGGTYVTFGLWPQTIKADGVTIDTTATQTHGVFTYCKGSDGAWYVQQAENAHSTGYEYSDGTIVGQGGTNVKWFKVEPIKWRVLTDSYSGKKLLLAESILTGGVPYYIDSSLYRLISGSEVKSSNYKYSTIRAWLNGSYESDDTQPMTYSGRGFLQSAFTGAQIAAIPAVNIDNSEGASPCDDTNDKVFLLSKAELINNGYGFGTDPAYNVSDSTRQRAATDFALATGVSYEYVDAIYCTGSSWWIRTPASDISVCNVVANGSPGWEEVVAAEYKGVVPALCVNP